MPRRRNRRSTRASGGPVSTSTRRPGASISAASPWPTSRNVTRRARGGAGEARADGHADASTSPASPPAMATDGRRRTIQASAPPSTAPSSARPGTAPSSQAPQRATRPTYAPRARMAASSATVAPGATGHTAQAASASQSSGATAGSASRFAGRLATSDVRPKCTSATGAVARVQASETASGLHNRNGTGVPSRRLRMAGATPWMAATAANESWNPGPVIAHGSSASTAGRREGEQMPRIASRSDQPGQRDEHARRCSAHDRRPASDDRRVGDDGGDRASVCDRSRDAGDPRESEHRCDQQHDVAAGDRQQMREPGRAERLERVVVERRGAAQRDARRDARRPVVAAGGERGARSAPPAIEHSLDAAPPSDHGDRACRRRLVHALVREPGAPVEVAAGRRHRSERAADHEDRALLQGAGRAELDRVTVRASRSQSCRTAPPAAGPRRRSARRRRARRARAEDRPRVRRARGPTRPRRRSRRPGRRRRSGRRSASRSGAGRAERARRARGRSHPTRPAWATRGRPPARARPPRRGRRCRRRASQGQPSAQGLQAHRPDAADLVELVDRAEPTVRDAVRDDPLRQGRGRCRRANRARRRSRR